MKRVPFAEIDGAPYADWWMRRFAPVADPFRGMRFYRRGRTNVWVGTADIRGLESTRMDAVGIHLMRVGRRVWKPTSTSIRSFGAGATRNLFDLEETELRPFLAGADSELGSDDPRRELLTHGFVVVRWKGAPLGCGEWHGRGVLASLVPRNQRLADIDL
jgi:NOL1/NOP2/fmu family ribosome biogenesis protein